MNTRVVLVEPENEGNIGAVARLMKNFGFSELFLVKPRVKPGVETMTYACHAREIVTEAVVVDDLHKALEGVDYAVGTTSITAKKSGNLLRTAITLEELAKSIHPVKGKVALLFGRESRGLSNMELEKCGLVVTIPSNPAYRTLNIASASALVFYEIWKAKTEHKRGYADEANFQYRARLVNLFDEILEKNRLPTHKRRLAGKAFKNIIARAFISNREATLIIGALRQTLQKLSSSC